jgi:hypothetical protein
MNDAGHRFSSLYQAAALSSLSVPRMTIFKAASGSGRCKAFASSQGARHPHIAFLFGGQEHRHSFRMDRLDDGVRRCRQKTIDEVRAGDRFRLSPAVAFEYGSQAGEGKRRAVVAQREPHDILLAGVRIGLWRVFGKAVGRHKAAVLRLQPSPPVRRRGVADVRDRKSPGRAVVAVVPSASSAFRGRYPCCERSAPDSRERPPASAAGCRRSD